MESPGSASPVARLLTYADIVPTICTPSVSVPMTTGPPLTPLIATPSMRYAWRHSWRARVAGEEECSAVSTGSGRLRFMNLYKWGEQRHLMVNFETFFAVGSPEQPAGFPDTREIHIQIRKWARLLDEHWPVVKLMVPPKQAKRLRRRALTKKELRQQGRESSRITQQGRVVNVMAVELLRQHLAAESARRGTAFSRQKFAEVRREWEAKLLEIRREFFRGVSSLAEETHRNALRELAAPRKRLGKGAK